MPLLKSISGIRGTIGGQRGTSLTPPDIINLVAAYAAVLKNTTPGVAPRVVIGRDSRLSGPLISQLVAGTLRSQGIGVVDLGLATAPTVEMVVLLQKAQGGIIITASHNPAGWNALKLLDARSEILTAEAGQEVYRLAGTGGLTFAPEAELGDYSYSPELADGHLEAVTTALLVDSAAIRGANFKVVVDGINSVGGIVIPELLRRLGVTDIIDLNCEATGRFAHKPEPLAENLSEICATIKKEKADLGVVVDPDVDRLAFIDEQGEMISEEYTIVAIADYVLANFSAVEAAYPGRYAKTTSSNLSSSRALRDVAEKHGGRYEAAAVGEINVVAKMKELKSFIGGEGNGGVIYPVLHNGRDALIGLALFLSALAKSGRKISEFQKQLPQYHMVKDRLELPAGLDLTDILKNIRRDFENSGAACEKITVSDGLKFDFADSWVHLRASNTEPIIRIYAEASDPVAAQTLVEQMKEKILAYIK